MSRLPITAIVISDGRASRLGDFLFDWGLSTNSTLRDSLTREGWGGGGDVARVEVYSPALRKRHGLPPLS